MILAKKNLIPFLDNQYPKLTQYQDLASAMESTPGTPWVFVENTPEATSLVDFTHPTDVVYCFGSDAEGLDVDRNLGDWISIPVKRALWANQAAAVVLGHRQFNANNR
jgi:tRNA(Leu) C34 or U34 (ribose-2'-O)-methylase TrmL